MSCASIIFKASSISFWLSNSQTSIVTTCRWVLSGLTFFRTDSVKFGFSPSTSAIIGRLESIQNPQCLIELLRAHVVWLGWRRQSHTTPTKTTQQERYHAEERVFIPRHISYN